MINLTGRILSVSEHNVGGWDDYQPVYTATYLDESGKVQYQTVSYGTVPDATPEVRAQYEVLESERRERQRLEREELEKHRPARGKVMEVLKGKNKGFIGEVKWVGESKYGPSALLIAKDAAGNETKVFTKPTNVKLVREATPPAPLVVGQTVEVLMGPNAGKVGVIGWMGETQYGPKVELECSGVRVKTSPKNLKPVAPATSSPSTGSDFLKELAAI